MSTLVWRDWSCEVRVVLADGIDHAEPPADDRLVRRVVGGLMGDVAAAIDRFDPDSELSRLNDATPALLPVAPLTFGLVDTALRAAAETGGACDPTIGAALLGLGYDADIDAVRSRTAAPSVVGEAAPAPGWNRVRLDRSLRRIGLPAGVRLDLNATAKAWTADEAARRLAARLGIGVLVSVGGDLAVAGGTCWPIRVSELAAQGGQEVAIDRGGVATSSTVARRWSAADGTEHHHIVDPRTGLPADGTVRTASVWARDCVRANALSTAAVVWGAEALERLRGEAARLVLGDGSVVTTPSWPGVPARTEVA